MNTPKTHENTPPTSLTPVPPIRLPVSRIKGLKLNVSVLHRNHPKNVVKATVMAVILSRGNKPIIGYNRRRFRTATKFTTHAEEDALNKAGRRAKGAFMIVMRLKKDRTFGLAKPCPSCESLRIKRGITKVKYSTEDWNVDEGS